MKGDLKAFTIMEMVVAMLLAAIAIGLTYTVFSIFTQTYSGYTRKNQLLAVPVRVEQLLGRDFDQAINILRTDSGLICESDQRPIIYQFSRNYILRKQIVSDTFKVNMDQFETFFEKLPVIETDSTDAKSRIDELKLKLSVENQPVTYHFLKLYSSANLIQTSHALN
ncbi:MAG TPA: hypothetical protein VNW51_00930 [Mucilaginibacter sp.]|jgi:type II secretory pathway component PulJ|nr:hypothetical protein [Mucilaginibacter sp.]